MFKQRLWIRGAGDLASGVAIRLFRSGFRPVMSEIAVPTTVRRTVAFSPAVYENTATVEDVTAQLCNNICDIQNVIDSEKIPLFVDKDGDIMRSCRPEIIIDAIMAKKNLDTNIHDAKIVVAIGPGFTAGFDCHCVIETQRGHDLGKVIWKGCAKKNTGIPGVIGGYSTDRIIRSNARGKFKGVAKIGDLVKKDDLIAYTDDTPILARIDGVVRGILQDEVMVFEGMKCGDIDPRASVSHCYTVSDKASSIGGGVLEAILAMIA